MGCQLEDGATIRRHHGRHMACNVQIEVKLSPPERRGKILAFRSEPQQGKVTQNKRRRTTSRANNGERVCPGPTSVTISVIGVSARHAPSLSPLRHSEPLAFLKNPSGLPSRSYPPLGTTMKMDPNYDITVGKRRKSPDVNLVIEFDINSARNNEVKPGAGRAQTRRGISELLCERSGLQLEPQSS